MGDYLGSVALPSMKMRQRKLCQIKQQPRAAPVYNDSSNFGVRMLEKLGWSEGKGLGKREDGMSAPILPKMKQDAEGFGYAGEKDDHWTQHDQDFNQLLKSLNGEEAPVVDEVDMAKIKSLEEKSKNSRARVHYKKFTRGKDLSRASEKDLANIFGKKTLEEVKNQSVCVEEPGDKDVEEDLAETNETNIIGLTTIKASMSVQDYFKSKMQEKIGQAKQFLDIEQEPVDEVEDCPRKKKSKKNKKNRKTVFDESEIVPLSEDLTEECEDLIKKTKKKKSKKEDVEISEEGENIVIEEPIQEEMPKKKSKKSKRSKVEQEQQCLEVLEECSASMERNIKVKALEDDLTAESGEKISEEKSLSKKQKNRKRKQSAEQLDCNQIQVSTDGALPVDCPNESKEEYLTAHSGESITKKRKKKRKHSDTQVDTNQFQSLSDGVLPKDNSAEEKKTNEGQGSPEDDEITCRVRVSVLKQLDESGFPGSNFADIVGYGLSKDVKLIQRESKHKLQTFERHQFVRQKHTSFQRKRQMLKKIICILLVLMEDRYGSRRILLGGK